MFWKLDISILRRNGSSVQTANLSKRRKYHPIFLTDVTDRCSSVWNTKMMDDTQKPNNTDYNTSSGPFIIFYPLLVVRKVPIIKFVVLSTDSFEHSTWLIYFLGFAYNISQQERIESTSTYQRILYDTYYQAVTILK
jgi:hypothetical protein